jgi:hypothetical protein
MARHSKFSKQNFLAATSLWPRTPSPDLSLAEQIMETKLRSEQAKLAMLEAEVPEPEVKYMRYEDMPPPSPEQEAKFDAEFKALLDSLFDGPEDPIGPESGETVQDWLTNMGATLPDLPEWKTPLYLDKFVPSSGEP